MDKENKSPSSISSIKSDNCHFCGGKMVINEYGNFCSNCGQGYGTSATSTLKDYKKGATNVK